LETLPFFNISNIPSIQEQEVAPIGIQTRPAKISCISCMSFPSLGYFFKVYIFMALLKPSCGPLIFFLNKITDASENRCDRPEWA
jgi:hypothetical protein